MTLWSVFMATYFGDAREQIGERMDPDVAALIDHGRTVSAVEYKQVELVRTDLWRRLAAVLADHDALLCPAMAVAAVAGVEGGGGEHREARREAGISPAMTTLFNLVPPVPGDLGAGRHPRPGRRRRAADRPAGGRSALARRRRARGRPRRGAQPRLIASRASSSSDVAAATGVRRAAWSSTTRSRPAASTTRTPASAQISEAAEVVPHAMGIGAHVDEAVERAGGDEAQVERRRRRSARNCAHPPPSGGAADPDDRAPSGHSRRPAAGRPPAPPPGPAPARHPPRARPRSAHRTPGWRPAPPPGRRRRRGTARWRTTARRGWRSSTRRAGRSPPRRRPRRSGGSVRPLSSDSTAKPAPWSIDSAAPSVTRSMAYWPSRRPDGPQSAARRQQLARCGRRRHGRGPGPGGSRRGR